MQSLREHLEEYAKLKEENFRLKNELVEARRNFVRDTDELVREIMSLKGALEEVVGLLLEQETWTTLPVKASEDKITRERECDKIYGIISNVERPGNKSDMAEAIYDAGYRFDPHALTR